MTSYRSTYGTDKQSNKDNSNSCHCTTNSCHFWTGDQIKRHNFQKGLPKDYLYQTEERILMLPNTFKLFDLPIFKY